MRISLPLLGALSIFLVGCASSGRSKDALCEPLLDFAQSIEPGETRVISFRTSWGGNFNDDPDPVIYAMRCEQGGYEPAKPACNYLMEHGAIEFSNNNAKRALSCLAEDTSFGDHIALLDGSFSIRSGTPDRGARLRIDYRSDEELGGMLLRIEARGY